MTPQRATFANRGQGCHKHIQTMPLRGGGPWLPGAARGGVPPAGQMGVTEGVNVTRRAGRGICCPGCYRSPRTAASQGWGSEDAGRLFAQMVPFALLPGQHGSRRRGSRDSTHGGVGTRRTAGCQSTKSPAEWREEGRQEQGRVNDRHRQRNQAALVNAMSARAHSSGGPSNASHG